MILKAWLEKESYFKFASVVQGSLNVINRWTLMFTTALKPHVQFIDKSSDSMAEIFQLLTVSVWSLNRQL